MTYKVYMFDSNMRPVPMCGDTKRMVYGQVKDGDSIVLRASRVYDQWFYTDQHGTTVLDHPGFDEARAEEIARELIGILVREALRRNKLGEEK